MKIYVISLIVILSGCATNSVRAPLNFEAYVNNLSYTQQKSKMINGEIGVKFMNEEPLEATYKECIKSSYAGFSVNLGGIPVSDPFKLNSMSGDYTTYTFMKSMGYGPASSDPVKALRNSVMQSPEFELVREKLEKQSSAVHNCLKLKGWEFDLQGK